MIDSRDNFVHHLNSAIRPNHTSFSEVENIFWHNWNNVYLFKLSGKVIDSITFSLKRLFPAYWSRQEAVNRQKYNRKSDLYVCLFFVWGWLVVFSVPSTARSFINSTPFTVACKESWAWFLHCSHLGLNPGAIALLHYTTVVPQGLNDIVIYICDEVVFILLIVINL